MKDKELNQIGISVVKSVPLNRQCPYCKKDCGEQAQNYPPPIGLVIATCENCNKKLFSNFKHPNFFWSKYE